MSKVLDQVEGRPYAIIAPVFEFGQYGRLLLKLRLPELGRSGTIPGVQLVLNSQCTKGDTENGQRFYAVRLEAAADTGGMSQVNLIRAGRAMTKLHKGVEALGKASEKAGAAPADIVVTILRYLRVAKVENVFVVRRINGPAAIDLMHHFAITGGVIPDGLVATLAAHKVALIEAVDGLRAAA